MPEPKLGNGSVVYLFRPDEGPMTWHSVDTTVVASFPASIVVESASHTRRWRIPIDGRVYYYRELEAWCAPLRPEYPTWLVDECRSETYAPRVSVTATARTVRLADACAKGAR